MLDTVKHRLYSMSMNTATASKPGPIADRKIYVRMVTRDPYNFTAYVKINRTGELWPVMHAEDRKGLKAAAMKQAERMGKFSWQY